MDVVFYSDIATISSAALALVGLGYTASQVRLSRVANSASLVVSLNDSLRASWADYLQADTDVVRNYHLDAILSTLELAITMRSDRLFRGHSGRYISEVIDEVVGLLVADEDVRPRLEVILEKHPGLRTIVLQRT